MKKRLSKKDARRFLLLIPVVGIFFFPDKGESAPLVDLEDIILFAYQIIVTAFTYISALALVGHFFIK